MRGFRYIVCLNALALSISGTSWSADCATDDPNDVMVKVGSWCVDKYGATICDSSLTGARFDASCISATNRNNSSPAVLLTKINGNGLIVDRNYRAYSKKGLIQSLFVSYYQALAACANAGKEVIPDSIRVAAALGTANPGFNDGTRNTKCNTRSSAVRATGLAGTRPAGADSCISQWGAEDLIGNVWEWTGLTSSVMALEEQLGEPAVDRDVASNLAQPPSTGRAFVPSPAIGIRGGGHQWPKPISAFTINFSAPGSHNFPLTGFRCARPAASAPVDAAEGAPR